MRIEWLRQKGGRRVIVFFNGWGMDRQVIAHLKPDCDLLVCYDYRQLVPVEMPVLSAYAECIVVAWSMGVWAAANVWSRQNSLPSRAIALNGTERPVHDKYGIPERIYLLTEKGMNEEGREKFFARMFTETEERECFTAHKPERELREQTEELSLIHKQSTELKNSISWHKVYVSEKDIIFPKINQLNWWQGKTDIRLLQGGHFPFYRFSSWNEIIDL